MLRVSVSRLPAVRRMLCTMGDGPIPMSIADRVEAEAVRKGAFKNLSGKGKPLPENSESQAYVASLPKNMEARAEAEMRRADRAGLLKGLGGEGEPLPDRHVVGSGSNQQAAIQQYVQRETMKK